MRDDNKNEESGELGERINSIKNIGYFPYTNFSRTTIICTAIAACVMIAAIAFLGQWYDAKLIEIGLTFGLAVIVILSILLYNYFKKQFFIECANEKNILIVGGFRRFRKYYVNNACYVIKKGQAFKVTRKKTDTVKLLFSEMKKSSTEKRVVGNKEIYSIKQKHREDFVSAALGGMPAKYGEMTFIDGKFKKGCYTSTSKMNYSIYFKVVEYDIRYTDFVPQVILNLLKKEQNDGL